MLTSRHTAVAQSAIPGVASCDSDIFALPRHSAMVRVTHWIITVGSFGLLVSGIAILLAHPRLYWSETGYVGAPSLIDLPLPLVLTGQTGWGRSLHFLCAWICVLTGTLYVTWGIFSGHFRNHLLPAKADFRWNAFSRAVSAHVHPIRLKHEYAHTYNALQRLSYLCVVFILWPLMIWSGLAMSPAVTSVFPSLVTTLSGQQSARTIHFFVAVLLVLFLIVHVTMVCLTGFKSRMRSMVTGDITSGERP